MNKKKIVIGVLSFLLLVPAGFGAALFFSGKPDLLGGADFSRVFLDREGRLLRLTLTSDEKYRIYTSLEAIPVQMQDAALLYEDRAFWAHPGVNPLALGRAAFGMITGGRRMGASTVTMQLARLAYRLDTTTVPGKLRQMWLALALERHYGKRDILEAYLNLVPYGGNIEGVGAAARVWFGKEAAHLNLPEILALVPVPQHPAARNPLALQGKALPEARLRLNALWREKYPDEQSDVFARVPLRVLGPALLPFEAPHAVNGLLREMAQAALPAADSGLAGVTEEGENPVLSPERPDTGDGSPDSGGGRENAGVPRLRVPPAGPSDSIIRTSIDLTRQKLLEQCVTRATARGRIWGMDNATALLLDWRDMEVRALVGSADFFNPAIQGQVDGSLARRSPGSTLKPFIYALALEQGLIHPQTILSDTLRTFHGYNPENADGEFRGPISARQALQASRNIPAISLAGRLEAPGLYGFLRNAGTRFQDSADHYGLALVLGGAEVSMRELAALYAMLPNRGVWRPLTLRRDGAFAGAAEGETAARACLMPEAAFIALDMMRMPSPQGFERVPCYWKTGTSNGRRDAWTVGVFGPYVLAVWVGRFDGGMNPGFTGMHAAAPLFFDIVQALDGVERLEDLPRRDREGLNLARVPACAATGDVNTRLCEGRAGGTVETWFIPGTSPIKESGILREILVDRETGLRQCMEIPGQTETVVWEFWPGDMRKLFARAGVNKPAPPPWAPECLVEGEMPGAVPEIVSPVPGVAYSVSLIEPEPIPLLADVEADVESVFWFAGTKFVGRGGPDEPVFWMPPPGRTELRVVDDLGRSNRLKVEILSRD